MPVATKNSKNYVYIYIKIIYVCMCACVCLYLRKREDPFDAVTSKILNALCFKWNPA